MKVDGYLSEIFCSVQGEGIYVGVTQIFLRLAGCSFCCGYCDTGEAAVRPEGFAVQGLDYASSDFTGNVTFPPSVSSSERGTFPNPVTPSGLSAFLEKAAASIPGLHSLSVTGGEPLEQPGFLQAFLPLFRRSGIPVYLETNGLHESAAAAVAPLVDIVSMDIKLPSLCSSGNDIFDIYSRVIPVFAGTDFFVKVVIDNSLDQGEFEKAVELVARTDVSIPFVIQPVTPRGGAQSVCMPPTPAKLMIARETAAAMLKNVRVIPQCHKLLGIR